MLSPFRSFVRSPRLGRLIATHSSVNPDEISHFSNLSAHWWDEHGEFEFLHKMNPVRMTFVRQKLLEAARDDGTDPNPAQVLANLDVLDVGCGGGLLSESLARLGANTLGIDASEKNIGIARQHASTDPRLAPTSPHSSLMYQHTTAEALLEQPKQFDVVCSMEVLEHVDNPASFLSTCAELVKPGGHLFLSTISRTPLAYFLTIFMAQDVLRKVSPGTHTYSKYIKPSELIQFFETYRPPTPPAPVPSLRESVTLADSLTSSARPWITRHSDTYLPRTQVDVRGLIYNPVFGNWHLAPKDAWGSLECNYIFWVRKPKEIDS
ncbi:ubiquinone biosynthesis O-methyltransferase [Macrolepiota fuliginosa MF-IS2]|uniref:Ubiquinone biosynthesis O-methyltransferase, mitochondrial n=1 Tax=Macrolepiota fuliginosa MF-IS2 TaxID=1400762 RepID=A0A9P6BVB1_9AGAR|nr:ubiquinone biosynthesis O-methyltransferase [Macrolepiota fuliginosa MF-IS2]